MALNTWSLARGTFMGREGKGLETMTDWESRYWSVIMSEAPPSGMGNDALTDMQVPLDQGRNYTIVVSRPEDRSANARDENSVASLDSGPRGEGIYDLSNRKASLEAKGRRSRSGWKLHRVRLRSITAFRPTTHR